MSVRIHLQGGYLQMELSSSLCLLLGHLARCWKLSCCSEQRARVRHALVEVGLTFGSLESPHQLRGPFGTDGFPNTPCQT
jgi:hypothetical protein